MDFISGRSSVQLHSRRTKTVARLLLFFNPVFSGGAVKLKPTKERKNRIVQLAVKYTVEADDAYDGSTKSVNPTSIRSCFSLGWEKEYLT